jgi:hypothetical protein
VRVELKTLQPNPFRNFKVDPIDQAVVDALKASIKENPAGFWGGIVARRTKHNGIQLAFGHHRVRAAIAAGIREDDIKVVPDISDAEMIRMYANENATQRGNTGTAIAGSVASAVRFLAKALFTHDKDLRQLAQVWSSEHAFQQSLQSLTSDRGLGEQPITALLDDIPGINEKVVRQQLGNLKASGDYDEIIEAVREEIEEENKEALKALRQQEEEQRKAAEAQLLAEQRAKEAEERRKEAAKAAKAAREEADKRRAEKEQRDAELAAKRAEEEAKLATKRQEEADKEMKKFDALRTTRDAADKAAGVEREVTFDFEGVAKYFKNASHIDTFRQIVTGPGLKPYLPVNRQAALAKKLVDGVGKGGELSVRYIRENVMDMVMNVKGTERKFNAEDKAELLRKDWSEKARLYQDEFSRHARGMLASALSLSGHARKRPEGVTLHVTSEFRQACKKVEDAMDLLHKARMF